MKKTLLLLTVIIVVLCWSCKRSAETQEEPRFQANWESLKQYEIPEWFRDAKFGIYTHWGVYSVPSWENEWYPRLMYDTTSERSKRFFDYHRETYGDQSEFGYKDFIPMFTAEKFDAREWADIFKRSGAQFAGPVAEHHDGFAMWDSDLTQWDAMDKGPKRDILGELAQAVRDEGMKFVTSFHHAYHWKYFEPSYDLENVDTRDPEYAGVDRLYPPIHEIETAESEEFLQQWYNKIIEVINKYEPDYLWFDFGWGQPAFEPYKKEFLAYYYNHADKLGKEVVVTHKNDHLPRGIAVLDLERGKLDTLSRFPWITDTSIDLKSWSYITEPEYKSVNTLVDNLVDRVSKNGNLLLNVGPKPDGTIPEEQKELLFGIGDWLKINGEAIYGTRPWTRFGEGPSQEEGGSFTERKGLDIYIAEDVRFTTKDNFLYIIALGWPENGTITVESLNTKVQIGSEGIGQLSMLGSDQEIMYERDENGLTIQFPAEKPCEYAVVFRLSVMGDWVD